MTPAARAVLEAVAEGRLTAEIERRYRAELAAGLRCSRCGADNAGDDGGHPCDREDCPALAYLDRRDGRECHVALRWLRSRMDGARRTDGDRSASFIALRDAFVALARHVAEHDGRDDWPEGYEAARPVGPTRAEWEGPTPTEALRRLLRGEPTGVEEPDCGVMANSYSAPDADPGGPDCPACYERGLADGYANGHRDGAASPDPQARLASEVVAAAVEYVAAAEDSGHDKDAWARLEGAVEAWKAGRR